MKNIKFESIGGGATLLSRNSKGFRAFTLAEVLITLGIIGIVAAMTIPTLIAKYSERQTVSQLTKLYSTLTQAYQMLQAEYGQLSTWGLKNTYTNKVDDDGNPIYDTSANQIISQRFKEQLRVARECTEGDNFCYPYAYYNLAGVKIKDAGSVDSRADASSKFYIQDGTFISFGDYVGVGTIIVILPTRKDATLGKNYFYFYFNDKGLFPAGTKDATNYPFRTCDSNYSGSAAIAGQGCAGWVIYNKNMDYMYCREKLSWDGAHSCDDAE